MDKKKFNPNQAITANGNIFGFPCNEENADLIIVPVPWDATASYGKGSHLGPQAILKASTQLNFFHHDLEKAHETKVFMTEVSSEWKKINSQNAEKSTEYIRYLEKEGEEKAFGYFKSEIENINHVHQVLTENLKERCISLLDQNKMVGILGGEHSVSLGLIQALNDKYDDFGVLHIDAHADLKFEYLGFEQSHASIMRNVMSTCANMSKLIQIGVRELSESEFDFSKDQEKISTYYDWAIKKDMLKGKSWFEIITEIINQMPSNIYISFDIDGLKPYLCPNTGTPVAGGFELNEVQLLFSEIINAGKNVIGFDLCEVSPSNDNDIDAYFGAQALWELTCYAEKSRRNTEK